MKNFLFNRFKLSIMVLMAFTAAQSHALDLPLGNLSGKSGSNLCEAKLSYSDQNYILNLEIFGDDQNKVLSERLYFKESSLKDASTFSAEQYELTTKEPCYWGEDSILCDTAYEKIVVMLVFHQSEIRQIKLAKKVDLDLLPLPLRWLINQGKDQITCDFN